ncbi:MAG: UDP-N-acetylmuramoyl-tripeptide--D-alanyl-D-alanine ligase [Verrucomicrobiota bacterium]
MRSLDPDDLAEWTSGYWRSGLKPALISGFCFDARKIENGQCFIALSSGTGDGHDFVSQAEKGGASALLVERTVDVDLPQLVVDDTLEAMAKIAQRIRSLFRHPVVGITGSSGKTSTKEMMRSLLGIEKTHTNRGNWNNRIGVPMTLFGLDNECHVYAVVEAGINQPKEMSALGEMIKANLCVITNIGPAHLELLGSLEGIALEKSLLFEKAAPDAEMILTADTFEYEAFSRFADRSIVLANEGEEVSPEPKRVIRYAIESDLPGQTRVSLESESFHLATASKGIATNAALAITAARYLGISETQIKEQIEQWQPAEDRGQWITAGDQSFYVDCYNANPASMADAIEAFVLSSDASRPRGYILGAMNELGDAAVEWHKKSGGCLQLREIDHAWFIGPSALISAYAAGAISNGADAEQIHLFEDVEKAKSSVAQFSGDLFLKGSRSYQLEKLLPVGQLT